MLDWMYRVSYGFSDWISPDGLPNGFEKDKKDYSLVNSNGVAVDPSERVYKCGGVIHTPFSKTVGEQIGYFLTLKELLPEASINYRSHTRVHVHIPGLIENLEKLKTIQRYIHNNVKDAFGRLHEYESCSNLESPLFYGGKSLFKNWRRQRVPYKTLLSSARVAKQMEAKTVDEFFKLFFTMSRKGTPIINVMPPVCINLQQLQKTNTIEFRLFAGSLNVSEITSCITWSQEFLKHAIYDLPFCDLMKMFENQPFPKYKNHDCLLEQKYRSTVRGSGSKKKDVVDNISKIIQGVF